MVFATLLTLAVLYAKRGPARDSLFVPIDEPIV